MNFFGCVLFIKTAFIVQIITADQLLLVQTVWRHGDRAPEISYPTDMHGEFEWPMGWGQLTALGMKQHLALGQLLRSRYISRKNHFLSPVYNPKQLYIRSTDMNRTLMSALANLAGMYPRGVSGVDHPKSKFWPKNWVPIPVHTVEFSTDRVGNIITKCDRVQQLSDRIHLSEPYLQIVKENEKFFNFITEKTGMKVSLDNIHVINDIHLTETLHNMSQPDWLDNDVAAKIRNLSEISSHYLYGIAKPYSPELIKLRGGNLLKLFVDNMKAKLDCALQTENLDCTWINNLKYYALSAHDTTIGALLSTLGDENEVLHGGLPQYTASVIFELLNITGHGPAVRILYHEAFHHPYQVITQMTKGCPNSTSFCPFELFIERSKLFLPLDIEKECAAK